MNIHFLSTGPKFPYSYYLGVMTALKVYDKDVTLWLTEKPKSKYYDALIGKVRVGIVPNEFPDFPALRGKNQHFKRVTKFDYFIWRIAHQYGGAIMGLDSLTLKKWDKLIEDKEMLVPQDDENIPESYSMHGVIVKKGSKIARQIIKDAEKSLKGEKVKGTHPSLDKNGKLLWGGAGIIPYLNNVYKNMDKVAIAKYGLVGGFKHDGSPFYLYQKDGKLLTPDTRTIPLYASSKKGFEQITEEHIESGDSLYSKLVKGVLTEKEWKLTQKPPKERKFRFHIPAYVHLPCSREYMGCAFTQKIYKMAQMLLSLGHEVFIYGAEGSDVPCTEFIQTHTLQDIRKEWGEGDNRFDIGYDWKNKGFKHDFNTARTPTTVKFYLKCIQEINKRKRPDDFLLIMQGSYHKPIDTGVKLFLTCEPGIGYRGSYAKYRAFESAYLQNFTYGSQHPFKSINGNFYDRVIPNYFDLNDFEFSKKKDNYFFFIGRLITRKGLQIAHKTCKEIGVTLKIAGQGAKHWDKDKHKLITDEFTIEGDHLEFVGYVDVEERKKLMSRAKAVFVPTLYLEAFGGVNVEAQLSGTAAIATNFGVFPETIQEGKTGFLCNTLNDFVEAAKNVDKLDPKYIRERAIRKYDMENVKWQFQRWFDDLYDVYESFQNPSKKGWHRIRKNNKIKK